MHSGSKDDKNLCSDRTFAWCAALHKKRQRMQKHEAFSYLSVAVLLAEGIESADQLNALRKCGCTEGQGYFFSRPLSVGEFATILKVGHAG